MSQNRSDDLPPLGAIEERLIALLSKRLGLSPQDVDIDRPFAQYGLASVEAISLIRELETWLGHALPSTLAWDYPSIRDIVGYFADNPNASKQASQREPGNQPLQEPIAIIGMGCRFPGAEGVSAFWQLLADGVDAITEVPPDRWAVDLFYDSDPNAKGKIISRWGGYLKDLDMFDAYFFGVSPREAAQLDPRQRLMLEVAWEALEDAGIPPGNLSGSRTGVFISTLRDDYGARIFEDFDIVELYSGTGSSDTVIPNRISYFLNLSGPSVSIDTACSGALISVHLACQSLRAGEASLALAGGVNVILEPDSDIFFSQAGVLSPDGRCKSFDSQANGIVRAEGAGLVVLKPLSQALADDDWIYAVIRGSALNHDGRSNGIMAPNGSAQEALLREAYRQAGVAPQQVQYIEAHGTGTPVGDPIEVNALGAVLADGRADDDVCVLGSLKTNVGHAEAAAGIAGIIKVALMLQHRLIPPHLHFREPNPLIPFDEFPFEVPQTLRPWPQPAKPLIAGVSGFGFAGANAHVVLEEPPPKAARRPKRSAGPGRPCLLPLSAKTDEALQALASAYLDFFSPDQETAPFLQDVCYTAGVARSHLDRRLALLGRSHQDLLDRLDAFISGEPQTGFATGTKPLNRQPKLVWVFSGQGSHWLGMGAELAQKEPVFRETLVACDHILQEIAGWSLLDELAADENRSRINDTEVTQPAIFAMQVSLAALWRSWGLIPDVIVGQSLGEVSAAHVVGALTLEEGVRIAHHRSRLMKGVEGQGKTAAVGLPLDQARLALTGNEDLVSVAGSNSPSTSLLSGDPATLARIVESLNQQGLFCRMLRGIDIAFHSPQMDPLKQELIGLLADLQPQPTSIPLFSTVTGTLIDGTQLDAQYWGRNLREPFLFTQAIAQLVQSGYDTFLEISPHPVLVASIMQGLEALDQSGTALQTLRRDEPELETMLASLAKLYTLGHEVDWARLYPNGSLVARDLPTYPWQRERYWLDQISDKPLGASAQLSAGGGPKRAGSYPLLGEHVRMAVYPWQHLWEMDMDAASTPYLTDHRVWGSVVMPGAAYLEMALAAAEQAFGPGDYRVEEIKFEQVLYLPEEDERRVQVVLTPDAPGEATFQVLSPAPEAESDEDDAWVEHVSGRVRALQNGPAAPKNPSRLSLSDIQARCQERVSAQDHYQAVHSGGLFYGPNFQAVQEVWRRDGQALSRLQLPAPLESEADRYHVHPVLLDASFQAIAEASPLSQEWQSMGGDTFLPVSVQSVRVYRPAGPKLWCHARLQINLRDERIREADLTLTDEQGQVVAVIEKLKVLHLTSDEQAFDRWLYDVRWRPEPLGEAEPAPKRPPGTWLIFSDAPEPDALAVALVERGETCILVQPGQSYRASEDGTRFWINPESPQDYARLLEQALSSGRPPCRAVIHHWAGLVAPPETLGLDELDTARALGPASVLFLVQALLTARLSDMPRLWLVTQGARAVTAEDVPSLAQAPVLGLARTIAEEQVELRCSLVDLRAEPGEQEMLALLDEVWADQAEDQVALRAGERYVARLERHRPSREARPAQSVVTVSEEAPFCLELGTPGDLDSLAPMATQRQTPGSGQVEVQVQVAGLNPQDVGAALEADSAESAGPICLGWECVGRITALGPGVEGLAMGDEVIAGGPACLSRYAILDSRLVYPKPAQMSPEEAATLLLAFGTVHYGLDHLARLGVGEWVLIHDAADGMGQAAIQLARLAGANLVATAATPEKRRFLRQALGLEHVFDSGAPGWVEEVLICTEGEGVDVVLSALSGVNLRRSLSLLKPYGRFVNVGQADFGQLLSPGQLAPNAALFSVDLAQLMQDRPGYAGEILAELWPRFESGDLQPLPHRVFSVAQIKEAVQSLAEARFAGKGVISIQGQPAQLVARVGGAVRIRPDGAYLITGGLGGLGSLVAGWLAEQGAGALVLVSRRGAEGMSPDKEKMVQELETAGSRVMVAKGDVTCQPDVARILDRVAQDLPPLRGVIHAAGIADDAVIPKMTLDRLKRVMAPKVQGAWNLHRLTQDIPLDFFILYSSVATLASAAGQSNYAAGNAFMDALAHYRRARGLPATSINWGPWGEVGMLEPYPWLVDQIAAKGFLPIAPDQGLAVLEKLLAEQPAQVAALPIDWVRFGKSWPAGYKPPIFLDLYQAEVGGAETDQGGAAVFVQEVLLTAPPDERLALLESKLQGMAAESLHLDRSRLDVHQPLNALGIDSIMALELRGRVKDGLGLPISVADLLRGLSVADMAEQFLPQLEAAGEEEDAELAEIMAEVESLSEAELQALLDEGEAAGE